MGISHKRFTGWEPRTSFEYDSVGRVVASTVEVEWDEEQRDLMVALSWYRDQICPLCGWLVEVCGDPQNANLIEATLPSRCYVTTNIDVAQEAETANNVVVQQPRGRLWGARLKNA